ncbi:MAG TPA: hypothetical protein P5120_09840 [Spirochaetota bacterium]|nr:hypothetical protein [Spirochaetota bacterium]HRX47808.1 hypothetical protein [Spirochaetota bacterium]
MIQSNDNNTLESKTIRSKVKEIAAISLFIVIAAVASIILADLIVFPLTHYAVKRVDIFNLVFENFLLLMLFLILYFIFIKKYRKLSDEGLTIKYIILYFLKRPIHYGSLSLSFLLISALMITVLYFLFSLNYYYLYKISGGV